MHATAYRRPPLSPDGLIKWLLPGAFARRYRELLPAATWYPQGRHWWNALSEEKLTLLHEAIGKELTSRGYTYAKVGDPTTRLSAHDPRYDRVHAVALDICPAQPSSGAYVHCMALKLVAIGSRRQLAEFLREADLAERAGDLGVGPRIFHAAVVYAAHSDAAAALTPMPMSPQYPQLTPVWGLLLQERLAGSFQNPALLRTEHLYAYMKQMPHLLATLHREGKMVHGNITPANVMYGRASCTTGSGGGGGGGPFIRVFLTDYAAARELTESLPYAPPLTAEEEALQEAEYTEDANLDDAEAAQRRGRPPSREEKAAAAERKAALSRRQALRERARERELLKLADLCMASLVSASLRLQAGYFVTLPALQAVHFDLPPAAREAYLAWLAPALVRLAHDQRQRERTAAGGTLLAREVAAIAAETAALPPPPYLWSDRQVMKTLPTPHTPPNTHWSSCEESRPAPLAEHAKSSSSSASHVRPSRPAAPRSSGMPDSVDQSDAPSGCSSIM